MVYVIIFIVMIVFQSAYCMTDSADKVTWRDMLSKDKGNELHGVKSKDDAKNISMHAVIKTRDLALVKKFLDGYKSVSAKVKDVNAKDSDGYPVLHWAIKNRYSLCIIKALLDAGALPDAKTSDGKTALHLAILFEGLQGDDLKWQYGVIEELIVKGANIEVQDSKGRTPGKLAEHLGELASGNFDEAAKFNYIALTVIPKALKTKKSVSCKGL